MTDATARFFIGQLVTHLKFGYRGVVCNVDPCFEGAEDWYARVALSRPPKDCPRYRVLVHGESHTTYVAERHLAAEDSGAPVRHPLCAEMFEGFADGRYMPRGRRH